MFAFSKAIRNHHIDNYSQSIKIVYYYLQTDYDQILLSLGFANQIIINIRQLMEGVNFWGLSIEQEKVMSDLQQWLYEGGAEFDSLKVVNFKQGYRGVVSTRTIQKKQKIVFIPKSHLITLEMAKKEGISAEIISKKIELLSPKHTFLAIFLLQELTKPQKSTWKHYFDILPKNHGQFPINYSKGQLQELTGSPFLIQIHERVIDLKQDYDRVFANSQSFRKYKFRDFCWARTIVGSRMFGVHINGIKTNILAPFADMLNHKIPKQTMWNYIQKEQGFVIQSLIDINEGVQVFDSYGKKCNSRYLLNYGFVIQNNPQNQICLKINFDCLFREKKLEMMKKGEGVKVLKITKNMNDNKFYEAMGFLRFRAISQFNQLAVLQKISGIKITNDAYVPSKTPPMTIQLQIAVWKSLQQLCTANLSQYHTSIEEDQRRLKQQKVSQNLRNILIIRRGQKALNHYFIDTCKQVIQILEKGYVKAFEETASSQKKPWAIYLFKILGIMPHQRRKQVSHLTIQQSPQPVQQGEQDQPQQS